MDYSQLTLKQKKDLYRTLGQQIHLMITNEDVWIKRVTEEKYLQTLKNIVKKRTLLKRLIEDETN